jgi:hypothetical protein
VRVVRIDLSAPILRALSSQIPGTQAPGASEARMSTEARDMSVRTSARKWIRVLRALANGRQLTRFDAEGLGDHSLNSTVAYLQAQKGIEVARALSVLAGAA